MHNLVYLLGKGSKWEDNELRYSLRSLKNLKGGKKVWIIGECPKFIKQSKVKYIQEKDPFSHKQKNTIRKLLAFCKKPESPNEFILMNDDFYFLQPTNMVKLYNRGLLTELEKSYRSKRGYYYWLIITTLRVLSRFQSPLCYDVHYPMPIKKEVFAKAISKIPYVAKPVLYRTVYGVTLGEPSEAIKDLKAYNLEDFLRLKNGHFMSSDNRLTRVQEFKDFLEEKFPEKSEYEYA